VYSFLPPVNTPYKIDFFVVVLWTPYGSDNLSQCGNTRNKNSISLAALLIYTADQQNVKQVSDHLPGSHLGAEKAARSQKEIVPCSYYLNGL